MRRQEWQEIVTVLATAVRELRALLGWSQQDVADHAVVSQGAISRMEAGDHPNVPFRSVVAVLHALGHGALAMGVSVSPTTSALLLFVQAIAPSLTLVPPLDRDVAGLLALVHAMPERQRGRFLAHIRSTAELVQNGAPT